MTSDSDFKAAVTRRRGKAELDDLVRQICQQVAQLEAGCEAAHRAAPWVTMRPRQQALLWSFVLLLARYNECATGWLGTDSERALRTTAPRLKACLSALHEAARRNTTVAAAASALRELLQAVDPRSILDRTIRYSEAPHPLVYLFELLIAESDQATRRERGAYYTPSPIVRYIVRNVDLLLRRDLGIPDGLLAARPALSVVDPACGSGAFLLGALDHIRAAGAGGGQRSVNQVLQSWMSSHRLTGIDVMPATSGVAELLVEQELLEASGVKPRPGAAAAWSVQCRNPLADVAFSRQLFADHVPVIVGNPPYNNFSSHNRNSWITNQLNAYKEGMHERKLNLDDDFIKFIRWCQYWIDQAGRGVVGLVTNDTYLSGLTHRRMRASLAGSFDTVFILDLHGSGKKRELTPGGRPDKNVFPIQQGVAIGLFVKTGREVEKGRIVHADLWGTRQEKLETLAGNQIPDGSWARLEPGAPNYFFVPRKSNNADTYRDWPRLDEVFQQYVSGVQTKRDKLFVGFTPEDVENQVGKFLIDAAQGEFEPDAPRWLRRKSVGVAFDPQCVRPYMVAPFDLRWVYYEPRLLGRARHRVMRHLDGANVALVFMRQTTSPPPYDYFLVTSELVSDRVFYSAHGAPFVAPLYLQGDQPKVANLQPRFLKQLAERLGAPFTETNAALPDHFGPRHLLHWIYAAAHDSEYREQFYSLLSIDFPRIPWPRDLEHFMQLCDQGEKLATAHLNVLDSVTAAGDAFRDYPRVAVRRGYPRWQADQAWFSNEFAWPEPIDAAIWNARIGGYPVLPRWLKQRQARELQPRDLDHFRRMVDAVRLVPVT